MLVDQSFFHKRDVVIDIETCGNSNDEDGVGRSRGGHALFLASIAGDDESMETIRLREGPSKR